MKNNNNFPKNKIDEQIETIHRQKFHAIANNNC